MLKLNIHLVLQSYFGCVFITPKNKTSHKSKFSILSPNPSRKYWPDVCNSGSPTFNNICLRSSSLSKITTLKRSSQSIPDLGTRSPPLSAPVFTLGLNHFSLRLNFIKLQENLRIRVQWHKPNNFIVFEYFQEIIPKENVKKCSPYLQTEYFGLTMTTKEYQSCNRVMVSLCNLDQ